MQKNKIKMLLSFGLIFILFSAFAQAVDLETALYEPVFIKTVCAGSNPLVDIQIYSGTIADPNNLVVARTQMSQDSSQDFSYMATFSNVGTYTAFMECSYDGGFISRQTATIKVYDKYNLITTSNYGDYNYQASFFYNVYFKQDSMSSNTILFDTGVGSVSFQPSTLKVIDANKKNIKTFSVDVKPQQVTGIPIGNFFTYSGIYGNGLDLQYLVNKKYVKEELVIQSADSLPSPTTKMLSDKNAKIMLELNSILNLGSNYLEINGAKWDTKQKISTNNIVLIKNNAGEIVYQLQIPVAFDSDGNKLIGEYTFEKVNDSINVAVNMDYNWFKDSNRVYPIYLDPTIDTQDGTGQFDNSTPRIVIDNLTIPQNVPYEIVEQVMVGNVTIMDSECEFDIINVSDGLDVVHFRSFSNDGFGYMTYTWDAPVVGTYTLSQYCWRGDILVLNKIYSDSTIEVTAN